MRDESLDTPPMQVQSYIPGNVENLRDMMLLKNQSKNLSPQNKTLGNIEKAIQKVFVHHA